MNNKIEQCKKDIAALEENLRKLQDEKNFKWIDAVVFGSIVKLDCNHHFLVGKCGGKWIMTTIHPTPGLFNSNIGGPWDTWTDLKDALRKYVERGYKASLVKTRAYNNYDLMVEGN